jgi:hypothetical protein
MLLDTTTRLKTSKHATLLKISSFDPPTNQHKQEQTRLTDSPALGAAICLAV